MKVLLAIPHVFEPKPGSLYSSQTEAKRESKRNALFEATIGNLNRHGKRHWIHASLGYQKPVVNRELKSSEGIDLTIQLYSPKKASLASSLPSDPNLSIIDPQTQEYIETPLIASRRLLEQSDNFDLIGYMEDDIAIHDRDFFSLFGEVVGAGGPDDSTPRDEDRRFSVAHVEIPERKGSD